MSFVPRFNYPTGTAVTLYSQSMAINRVTEDGYEIQSLESGETSIIPFEVLVNLLDLPGTQSNSQLPLTGDRLQARLGGYVSARSLAEEQKRTARFHVCVCQAMVQLEAEIRAETGNPKFSLSIRKMDRSENRIRVARLASKLFGQQIFIDPPRIAKGECRFLRQGRTLMDHFRTYTSLKSGEDPIDALAPLDHLKGNRARGVPSSLQRLMQQAWEEVGLDTKGPSVANVHKHLEMLVHEANKVRRLNDLDDLSVPRPSTLRAFRDRLLSPTELLIATKGERHARNKRGRGSSDIPALCIGEQVEIDECKISLVSAAKEHGIWVRLAADDKRILEKIDKEIRARLVVLIMIDVASRMPLAWVISDKPGAEPTRALLRMATRDKTREARMYGCTGKPMPAIGLGNIRMDNGPGLRNSSTFAAMLGLGATVTTVRTYAPTDKPFVERMFGTLESVLFKLIHGYTGRRPGEITGNDPSTNGVLYVEELYGLLTRYLIDEYPSTPHLGIGMGGRRPAEVAEYLNRTRGCFRRLDRNRRRLHLGWEVKVTPTDEGVRVFGGLWYDSPDFQKARDHHKGKVSAFVDPDNLTHVTALVPGSPDIFELTLQTTAFADLTLPEMLELMTIWRRENLDATEIHEDRIMQVRRDRHEMLKVIGVERRLSRTYSTFAECYANAKALWEGARLVRTQPLPGTALVGNIARMDAGAVFQIGTRPNFIEGAKVEEGSDPGERAPQTAKRPPTRPSRPPGEEPPATSIPRPPEPPGAERREPNRYLGRPKNVKRLE